jgi:putative ABC transport system permease protein
LAERITATTQLRARTSAQMSWDTVMYYVKNTGIVINFGIAVLLGFLVGIAIAGQTFYNFTLDNLRYFGALKAMGGSNWLLLRMVLLQALVAGVIGYGLGVGAASLFGMQVKGSELAFRMTWHIPAISGAAVALICALSSIVSMIKVIRLEPAVVFRG